MKEPFDPRSILGRNHLLNPQPVKLELKKGGKKKRLVYRSRKILHDSTHKVTEPMESSTLSTHQLPIILAGAPIHL